MTTYTVFDMEADEGHEEWSGLSLRDAVLLLLEKSRHSCNAYRTPDGLFRLKIEPAPFCSLEALTSDLTDDRAAFLEIGERFATGEICLRGAFYLCTDEYFRRQREVPTIH